MGLDPIRVVLFAETRASADRMLAMIQSGTEGGIACRRVDGIDYVLRQVAEGAADVLIVMGWPRTQPCKAEDILSLGQTLPVLLVNDGDRIGPLSDGEAAASCECLAEASLTPRRIRSAIRSAFERRRFEEFLRRSQIRFRKIISSEVDAVLLVDPDRVIRYANRAAEALFRKAPGRLCGTHFDHPLPEDCLMRIDIEREDHTVVAAEMVVSRIDWQGADLSLVSLRDITERDPKRGTGGKNSRHLQHALEELDRPRQMVADEPCSAMEEERLRLLLQIAGATAHELNQPLMALLGSIDLIRIHRGQPDKLTLDLNRIEAAGKSIAEIVRKVQTVQRYETKPYLRGADIIDLDQRMNMLFVIDSDRDFSCLEKIAARHPRVGVTRSKDLVEAKHLLQDRSCELILIDSALPSGSGFDLLSFLYEKGIDTPVVVLAGEEEDVIASRLIKAGAYDYLPKGQMTESGFNRVITNVQEKRRLQREVDDIRKRMAQQAVIDEKSGLFNRRFFMEVLGREMSRARRHGLGLAVAVCEPETNLDACIESASANDAAALSMVGNMLVRELRRSDLLCRYGSSTLGMLFPQTHAGGLLGRLEFLRDGIKRRSFTYKGNPVRLRIDIGICAFENSSALSPAVLMKQAESALEVARRTGVVHALGMD